MSDKDIPKEVELREGERIPSKRFLNYFKLLWKSAESGEIDYKIVLLIINLILTAICLVVSYVRV